MRGKEIFSLDIPIVHGITPAYAGKSTSGAALPRKPGDHPRVCGEKNREQADKELAYGSPPRMRGKGTKPRREPA